MSKNLKDWEDKGFVMENGRLVSKSSIPSSLDTKKPYNKYGNRKMVINGITFDSEKEGKYYQRLILLKKSGEVKDFKMQVRFDIIINDTHIAYYLLDFQVEYPDGTIEYIDIKAKKKDGKWVTTDVFQLKKKLVQAIHGIEITLY